MNFPELLSLCEAVTTLERPQVRPRRSHGSGRPPTGGGLSRDGDDSDKTIKIGLDAYQMFTALVLLQHGEMEKYQLASEMGSWKFERHKWIKDLDPVLYEIFEERGNSVDIPDVEVTMQQRAHYERFARNIVNMWTRGDPIEKGMLENWLEHYAKIPTIVRVADSALRRMDE